MTLRGLALSAMVLLGGCETFGFGAQPLPPAAPAAPAIKISPDGRTLITRAQDWHSPEGVTFFERGGTYHVFSIVPGKLFDYVLRIEPDGTVTWPENAPFEAKGGELHFPVGPTPGVNDLVESGQLYRHDDHLHLTHRFKNADWQALYAARADTSPLEPIRRQVAANVLATLVDLRIPAGNEEETKKALEREIQVIAKARRGLELGLSARQIDSVLDHNYEILDGGKRIEIEGRTYLAKDNVQFAYCSDHFHVEDVAGRWAQPILFSEQDEPGHFTFPKSIFFDVAPDLSVKEKPISSLWQRLASGGEIRFTRDHWHITEKYNHPKLALLAKAMDDAKRTPEARDDARGRMFDILRLRLDLGSEQEFAERIKVIDRVIDRHWADFEKGQKRTAGKK